MKVCEASAPIAASPERVWAILTNAAGYTEWDSGVERVTENVPFYAACGFRIGSAGVYEYL